MSMLQASHYEVALSKMRQETVDGIIKLPLDEPLRFAFLKGKLEGLTEAAQKYRDMDRSDLDEGL